MSRPSTLPENEQFEGVTASLPPKLDRGRPTGELREAWLVAVERLMLDGVDSPSEMARRTGLTRGTSARWMCEVRAGWRNAARTDVGHGRREELYAQAEAVSASAWRRLGQEDHPLIACALLRVALDAWDRKARLLGVDAPR